MVVQLLTCYLNKNAERLPHTLRIFEKKKLLWMILEYHLISITSIIFF